MRIDEIVSPKTLNEYKKIDYFLHKKKLQAARNDFEQLKKNKDKPKTLGRIAADYSLSPRLLQSYLIDMNVIQ